jgi:hypothetical protein
MSLFRDLLAVFNPRFGQYARYRHAPGKLHEAFRILADDLGLLRSMKTGLPADGSGAPVPWFAYPAIDYLNQFNLKGKRVFEYGSGQSTRYWARRGASVWSAEHDEAWYSKLSSNAPPGCTLYFGGDQDSYVNAIALAGVKFDIVVIDGILRDACVDPAIAHLAPNGFIILDNADRDWPVGKMLRERGFFEVDFSGFGPINDYVTTTAIFLPPGGISQTPDFQPPRPVGHHHDNVYGDQ